ncbi:MAG: hypothetical protein GXO65_07940 [Euryarchaeota archaeon]|nr:hypothetical protein [Euryarchaeota archaeon]
MVIALIFGKISVAILGLIPNAVFGVLLFFAGMELAMLVRDVKEKKEFFIVFTIATTALATTNMGIAFVAGMVLMYVMEVGKVEL